MTPVLRHVLALVIDFRTHAEAERLTLQLAASHAPGVTITVLHVDNGNAEPVLLSPAQTQAGVRLLRLKDNEGYAGGILGALHASAIAADAYWFLNSDLEIEPDTLSLLLQELETHPRAGAVGPTVLLGKGPRIWGARGVISPWLGATAMTPWPQGGALPRWSYIPGSSILVRAQAYQEVGGLPARYRMYYEETELCVRLQKAGWDLRVVPQARAYHQVKSLEDKIPARHFAFYFARNNLYFWRNNFGIPAWLQFPRLLFVAFKELILPLRRVPSWRVFRERVGCVLAGLGDSFAFLRSPQTPAEVRLFGPRQESKKGDPA